MTRYGTILFSLLLAAACRQTPTTPFGEKLSLEAEMECALGADGAWSKDCTLERSGSLLTIRHPDGGFRRFNILPDGRGLEAADGSERAAIQIIDKGGIEVRVGGDRYRLPARVKEGVSR